MDNPQVEQLDHRLTELEIKASWSEDTLDRLNEVVVRQQAQIDLLVKEVTRLRDEARARDSSGRSAAGDVEGAPSDERPPHY